jgi:hypothetical protein
MIDISAPTLLSAEVEIRRRVDISYIDPRGKAKPIYDGIIDCGLYLSAPMRLMWILKEPWDSPDSSGGGWSLSELLASRPVRTLSQSTYHPIIYIAYGLFYDVLSYDAMPRVGAMEAPERILRSLAIANAKKLPGVRKGARQRSVMSSYSGGREIIADQIRAYAPGVVFGCAPHFPEVVRSHSSTTAAEIRRHGSASYTWRGSVLFVQVYHPGQTNLSRKNYVEDAIAATRAGLREKNA